MKRGLKFVGGLRLLTSALTRISAADDPRPKDKGVLTNDGVHLNPAGNSWWPRRC